MSETQTSTQGSQATFPIEVLGSTFGAIAASVGVTPGAPAAAFASMMSRSVCFHDEWSRVGVRWTGRSPW
jgi:hypothetical protein